MEERGRRIEMRVEGGRRKETGLGEVEGQRDGVERGEEEGNMEEGDMEIHTVFLRLNAALD